MASGPQILGEPHQKRRPTGPRRIWRLRELMDDGFIEIRGKHAHDPVGPPSKCDLHVATKNRREDKAIIVIGVLADQVDATWRPRRNGGLAVAEALDQRGGGIHLRDHVECHRGEHDSRIDPMGFIM